MQYTGNLPSGLRPRVCACIIKHSCSSTCITSLICYRAQKDTSDDKCDDGGSGDSPQENEPGEEILYFICFSICPPISLTQYHAHVHVQCGGFYNWSESIPSDQHCNFVCLSVSLCVHCYTGTYRYIMDRHTIFAFGWHDLLPTST